MLTSSVFAAGEPSSLEDVRYLLLKGKVEASLTTLKQVATAKRLSKQGRLLRGVLLSKLGRLDEATKVFEALSNDYPESPEPLNNLAVLYAGQGMLEQARSSLLRAIELHPTHANARRNLGDLYLHLAMSSYQHAQKLESGNHVVRRKIEQLKHMLGQRSDEPVRRATAPKPVKKKPIKPVIKPVQIIRNQTVPTKSTKPSIAVKSSKRAKVSQSAGACLLLGPFSSKGKLSQVSDWMRSNSQSVSSLMRSRKERIYQVYHAPLASMLAAKRRLAELKARRIDGFVVRSGEIAQGISLGAFQELSGANKMIRRLKKKGVDASYREQNPLRKRHWLRWQEGDSESSFSKQLHKKFKNINWPPEAC